MSEKNETGFKSMLMKKHLLPVSIQKNICSLPAL